MICIVPNRDPKDPGLFFLKQAISQLIFLEKRDNVLKES